ncbi:MAG: CPBP family glutamic-type intramembrane protease [Gammaproteobacteria bacterium]|nr:CPBP family glutamic-type intramembrane protease [Gammaproteobacteria bacterium]MDE0302767.1 CPBP family glutamic-type intramembrane protease [Gammaproteobacteria bacterium]
MRSFWTYALLLLAALAGGAFLWGLIYAVWPLPVPHHKLVKYGALLVAVVVLVLWARRRVTRDALGLSGGIESLFVQGLVAFSLTAVLLIPLWLFLLEMNARFLDPWMWSLELSYKLAGYLVAALAVATVEELYFRGLLLSRVSGYGLPLIASALFFAGIHFLNPTPDSGLADQWNGGWLLLANATLDMPEQWLEQLPRLSLLLLIGLGLGLVRLRTGSLAFCIGAHAAMVFSLKSFQFFTYPGPFGPAWLGTDASGGWTGVAWMAILVLGLWRLSPKLGKAP